MKGAVAYKIAAHRVAFTCYTERLHFIGTGATAPLPQTCYYSLTTTCNLEPMSIQAHGNCLVDRRALDEHLSALIIRKQQLP